MADEKRRVEIKYVHKTEKGTFVEWGRDVTYDEGNNAIPVTRAIVELDNGQVILAEPPQICFLDRK
ncbi:hypothetical protein JLDANKMP_00899 [Stenotrophomonas sp. PE591]|nr:hypothetical protein [Stenotrophomonas sp. PE591]